MDKNERKFPWGERILKEIKSINKKQTKALCIFNIYRDLVFEDYNFVDISVKFDNTGMIISNEIIPRVYIQFGMSYACIDIEYETPKTLADKLFSDLEDTLENLSFKTFIK